MNRVRAAAPQLAGLVPYDPKYLPAEAYLSANENPRDVDAEVRAVIAKRIAEVPLNRYPDPLANRLRDMIAEANGLDRASVLVGNGGDELLFDLALAWGGPGRSFLNLPPTFSVYEANARLTNTRCVNVPRREDFSIDEEAVLARVAAGDIDFVIVTSPNNPTGLRAPVAFIEQLLAATDALVLVDEAYFEFSRETVRPLLEANENLVILRTFSKAFSLAGVRLGYILANPAVIEEFLKVRQPYSVDALSQVVGEVVFEMRARFEPGIREIIEERARVAEALRTLPGVTVYPSDSNWILLSLEGADEAWQYLYDKGVLVRDFSRAPMLEGCLRATIGTPEQNDAFVGTLRAFIIERNGMRAQAARLEEGR
ncbi:histidinol-phosphate transaminase [Adlercreutzia sp. R25]|uniref:histidinol-phosphate transaminase n=1 Tax=Adlercreutzia shanghongiae TaxID=3111773 RepID=UPI002DB8B098|nr:histidinol-phosphate transaminase [Adlercreutzia sp. R25]MEC4273381.1 histidinol-phosphate transaminase [Adlercreutzia sp. R25]